MLHSLKKLWLLLTDREKYSFVILTGGLLVKALLEMVGVGLVPAYIGVIAYPEKLLQQPIIKAIFPSPEYKLDQTTLLYWGAGVLFLFFSIKLGLTTFMTYWQTRYTQNRILRIGKELFTSYMKAPYTFHLERNTAELLRNISSESVLVGQNVLSPLLEIISNTFIMTAIIVLLVFSSPGSAIFSILLFLGTAGIAVAFLHKRIKRLGVKVQEMRGKVIRNINEGLGGVKELKVLNRESFFVQEYYKSHRVMFSIHRFMQVMNRAITPLMEWVSVTGLLCAFMVLLLTGTDVKVILPIIVLFAVGMVRMKAAIAIILAQFAQLQLGLVSLNTVYDDLNRLAKSKTVGPLDESKISEKQNVISFKSMITVKNLKYSYPNSNELVLQDVHLTIRRGEAIGFVGTTGAGKSTLIDLILGVLTPKSGRILVDDADIQDNMGAWQRNIGYIPQSIYLIDGTIKQNIALGLQKEQIDATMIEQAVSDANLKDFVQTLSDGLETVVGEQGVRLSGGQRQRIAIARALYNNPDVLIMDEATSALDNVTERFVITAVERLKGRRTILIIAHRLSTIRNCNRIVFLQNGQINAIGTYDELLANHKMFRQMAAS